MGARLTPGLMNHFTAHLCWKSRAKRWRGEKVYKRAHLQTVSPWRGLWWYSCFRTLSVKRTLITALESYKYFWSEAQMQFWSELKLDFLFSVLWQFSGGWWSHANITIIKQFHPLSSTKSANPWRLDYKLRSPPQCLTKAKDSSTHHVSVGNFRHRGTTWIR